MWLALFLMGNKIIPFNIIVLILMSIHLAVVLLVLQKDLAVSVHHFFFDNALLPSIIL